MKLFDIESPYKRCYFKTCLPTRQSGVESHEVKYPIKEE